MPSLARRLVILLGLAAGGLGAYLAYWGGYEPWRWAADLLMVVPLPALAIGRRLSRTDYDTAELKSRIGAAAVDRLSVWQAMAMLLVVVSAVGGFLLPPAFADPTARHRVMIGALAGLGLGGAIGTWVEARYRAMLAEAGMLRG